MNHWYHGTPIRCSHGSFMSLRLVWYVHLKSYVSAYLPYRCLLKLLVPFIQVKRSLKTGSLTPSIDLWISMEASSLPPKSYLMLQFSHMSFIPPSVPPSIHPILCRRTRTRGEAFELVPVSLVDAFHDT